VEDGGLALSWTECCAYLEQAGRSFLGLQALGCAPPTQPDVFALDALASPAQRQRYLEPLMRGERKSCFAMTEPAPVPAPIRAC
jgi:acyl-CoA dehydrogenase